MFVSLFEKKWIKLKVAIREYRFRRNFVTTNSNGILFSSYRSLLLLTVLISATIFLFFSFVAKKSVSSTEFRLTDRMERALKDVSLYQPTLSFPEYGKDKKYKLLVDKKSAMLAVIEHSNNRYKIVRHFKISTGSIQGDKYFMGDSRTPEGVYKIIELKKDDLLGKQFGPRAYVLNYPNELDKASGKTGLGIWIHGSGLGRSTRDTRGCVELNDFDIIELEKYVSVGTPVYILPENQSVKIDGNEIAEELIKPEMIYSAKTLTPR